MPDPESTGLRERKRLATRQAIQSAVLRLALERGLEHVTVEEVSREADISPRTFFNYFVSKEAAIAGDAPDFLDEERVTSFVERGSGDILRDLGELMASGAERSSEIRETVLLRRDLHTRYPHLFALRMANMRVFEDELTAIIARRLVYDAPQFESDRAQLESRARLITLVAFGALRHAWICWAAPTSGLDESLANRLRDSFDQLDQLLLQTSPA
jgi:AcrR family transcriptional regulator